MEVNIGMNQFLFFNLIRPHLIDSMKHKVDYEEYKKVKK